MARATVVSMVLLSGQAAHAERSAESASEALEHHAANAPVSIHASSEKRRAYESDSESGRISVRAGTLDFLIRIAFDVHPRDIVYETPLDREALYDVIATPPDASPRTAISMIRKQLEATFGFEASPEIRRVPVHIMRRLEGGIALAESTSKHTNLRGSRGRFAGTRASMGDLARFARTLTPHPVIDETGLTGFYDIIMEWDASAGGHALVQAFEDLGLELVDGERSVKQLIVRRASDGLE